MTAQTDPYVRVYYRIIDDDRFANVYDDDRSLALWLRLLLVSDAMYPAPAPIPAGIHRGSWQKLVRTGLIDPVGRDRFRVHGLGNERERRTASAAAAANARWNKDERPGSRAQAGAVRIPGALRPDSDSNAGAFERASAPPMLASRDSAPIRSYPLRSVDADANASPPPRDGLTEDQRRAIVARGVLDDRTATEADREKAKATLVEVGAPLPQDPEPPKPRPVRKPPEDEEVVAKCRAIVADPDAPDWKRLAAMDQLSVMGVPA